MVIPVTLAKEVKGFDGRRDTRTQSFPHVSGASTVPLEGQKVEMCAERFSLQPWLGHDEVIRWSVSPR